MRRDHLYLSIHCYQVSELLKLKLLYATVIKNYYRLYLLDFWVLWMLPGWYWQYDCAQCWAHVSWYCSWIYPHLFWSIDFLVWIIQISSIYHSATQYTHLLISIHKGLKGSPVVESSPGWSCSPPGPGSSACSGLQCHWESHPGSCCWEPGPAAWGSQWRVPGGGQSVCCGPGRESWGRWGRTGRTWAALTTGCWRGGGCGGWWGSWSCHSQCWRGCCVEDWESEDCSEMTRLCSPACWESWSSGPEPPASSGRRRCCQGGGGWRCHCETCWGAGAHRDQRRVHWRVERGSCSGGRASAGSPTLWTVLEGGLRAGCEICRGSWAEADHTLHCQGEQRGGYLDKVRVVNMFNFISD